MRISFMILVLIGLFACKKQNTNDQSCADQPPLYISPEISNFKFKMGTYWVFIDSVTSQIDTMKITGITSDGLVGNSHCSNQKHEYYVFTVNKKYDDINSGYYDIYSLQGGAVMLNQTEEAGNNYIYMSNSVKIDSLFIYDRYYKSIVKAKRSSVTLYYNNSYGLLKIESSTGKKLLKDKLIVR